MKHIIPTYVPGAPDPDFIQRLKAAREIMVSLPTMGFVCITLRKAGASKEQLWKVTQQLELTFEQSQLEYPEMVDGKPYATTYGSWLTAVHQKYSDGIPSADWVSYGQAARLAWIDSMIEIETINCWGEA